MMQANATRPASSVVVWDLLVRFGHWGLVAAFAVAYLSAEGEENGPDALHVWSGYVVGTLVLMRVIWGFIGSKHARFGDFVRPIGDCMRYLADLGRGRARRYIGHSPAGGLMVLTLLAALTGTVVTGVITYGELGKGPLASLAQSVSPQGAGADKEKESAVGEIHEVLANVTLALIGLHVLGVIAASVIHRESLVAAMITGRKRAEG
ncbi:cytochrome b/b6 domain-containing protein [Methylocapsa acidiphila]|uniref:cytochrome b/b6 domain-containing protein n=1 Tax=Methylocapsa acidiphila TaxID=133552 RepID=UPI0003F9F6D1|nr:cytochrome b/b6 domain-containing protein [Methylocapsa acidiphila]